MFVFLTLTVFWISTDALIDSCPDTSTLDCVAYGTSYGDEELCCFTASNTGGVVEKYKNKCYYDCQMSNSYSSSHYYCGECCSTDTAINLPCSDSTQTCSTQSDDATVTNGYCHGYQRKNSTACGRSDCDATVSDPCKYKGGDIDLECVPDGDHSPACYMCQPSSNATGCAQPECTPGASCTSSSYNGVSYEGECVQDTGAVCPYCKRSTHTKPATTGMTADFTTTAASTSKEGTANPTVPDACASFGNECENESDGCERVSYMGTSGSKAQGRCEYNSQNCLVCRAVAVDTTTNVPTDPATSTSDPSATTKATTAVATDTTNTDATTSTPDCDTDRYPFKYAKQMNCDDADPGGCRLVIGIEADVCNINGRWTWRRIQYQVKQAIGAIVNDLEFTASECDFSDLSNVCAFALDVEAILSNVDETDADQRGSFIPATSDECPDLDAYCGADGSRPQFAVSLDLGLHCESCDELKELKDAFTARILAGNLNTDFQSKCEYFSKQQDTVCGEGFRNVVLVDEISIALQGADGTVKEEDVVSLGNNASHHAYYFGVIAVLAVLSFFY